VRVLIVAIVSSLALASCGTSQTRTVTSITTATTPPATPASVSTATTTAVAPVYFAGAVGRGLQRPSSLQLSADGTLVVSGVQWTSWGGAAATGSGTAEYHGCTPNCAQATPQTAVVSIRLSVIRACSGRRFYSSITLTKNSGQLLDESFLQRSWSPC
jgi:hypothetical protein